jgi:hypothetical protein
MSFGWHADGVPVCGGGVIHEGKIYYVGAAMLCHAESFPRDFYQGVRDKD